MVYGEESCSLLDDTESLNREDERPFHNLQSNEAMNITSGTMEHCHSLLLLRRDDKNAEKVLQLVASLSAIFILLEFSGGLLANSLSIMTDAGHMLSDFLSFAVSIVMIRVSKKPATRHFSFGFMRAEIIGALISVFIIWTLTVVLIIFATQRIISGQYNVDADTMLLTACLGVAFNIAMALILKYYNNGLIPGHAHCEVSTNVNVRAAFIHVLGDFVQSVGVLVAAMCIKLFKWELADPLCTYIFSVLVLCTSMPVFKDVIYIFMESTPNTLNYEEVHFDLLRIEGVLQVHSLNIWSLSTAQTALSTHLVVENASAAAAITKAADKMLKIKHKLLYTTVQIESLEDVDANCEYCKDLP